MVRLQLVRPDGQIVLEVYQTATGFFTDDTLLYIQSDDADGGVFATVGKTHVFTCRVVDEIAPVVRH